MLQTGSYNEQGSAYQYTQILPDENTFIGIYSNGVERKKVYDYGMELETKLDSMGYELLAFGSASLYDMNNVWSDNRVNGFDWCSLPDGKKFKHSDGAKNGVMDMVWNKNKQSFVDVYGYEISEFESVITPAFVIKGNEGIREMGEPGSKTNRMVMLVQEDQTVTFLSVDKPGLNKSQLKTLCDKWHSVTACAFDGGGSVRVYNKVDGNWKLVNKATDNRLMPNIWFIAVKKEEVKPEEPIKHINDIPVYEDLISLNNVKAWDCYSMDFPIGITIHNTGNSSPGANALNHANYLDKSNSYVSYHYVVDDKEIRNVFPINLNCWHASDGGGGDGNRRTIAIEICENSDGDWKKARSNAIELIKDLVNKFNFTKDDVYTHKYWSETVGKDKYCPHIILDEGWNEFLNEIFPEDNEEIINELLLEIDGYKSEIAELNKIIEDQNNVMIKQEDQIKRIRVIVNE